MIEHWSNTFRRAVTLTMGPIGFISNIFLFVIILKNTPDSMKTYSTMIIVMVLSDIVNGLCSFITSVRMVPRNPQLFIIFNGFCEQVSDDKTIKSRFCMYWYSILVNATILSLIIMIFSFIYRGIVITMPFDTINRKFVKLAVYGYSIMHFCYVNWVYFMGWVPMDVLDEEISKVYPELVGSNFTYSGIVDLNAPSQIVLNYLTIFSPWVVVIAAVICRWKIGKFLRNFTFSNALKQQHKSLLNVLLYQTISPFLYTATVVLLVSVGQNATPATALLENITPLPLVIVPVVSPIITISLIAPYRVAFLKIFKSVFGRIIIISIGNQANFVESTNTTFSIPAVG